MRQLLLIQTIITAFMFAQTDGEVVKNVSGAQRTDGSKVLDIYYDLESSDLYTTYDVYVQLEWPDVDHAFYLEICAGDVWFNVHPGENKQISCQLAADYSFMYNSNFEDQFLSGEFYINVIAEASAASEHPFEMVTINATELTENFDYDYELMKTEVTASEFVEFLNDYLSTAENVVNNDVDYWEDIEGGEIFNRIFVFGEGKPSLVIEFDVNSGDGSIQFYSDDFDLLPPHPILSYGQDELFYDFLRLNTVSDDDLTAKIQFSSTAAGADDFSFFISPGRGNDPIMDISLVAAVYFADYYGLRLPTYKEILLASYNEIASPSGETFSLDSWMNITLPSLISDNYYNPNAMQEEFDETFPVNEGYEFASNGLIGLFSNAGDIFQWPYDIEYIEPELGTPYGHAYGYFQLTGNYYDGEFEEINGDLIEPLRSAEWSFRCARPIPGSYTGNND